MGAILAILSAVATAVANAVGWVIRTMPPLGWLLLVVLLGGIYLGNGCSGVPSGCSLRELACGCKPKPPRPPRSETFDVVAVPTGASIEVVTGLRGRKTAVVALQGIQAPNDGEPLASDSRASLERLAGSTVRVEWKRGGLLRSSEAQDSPRQQEEVGEAAAETPEARPPDTGVVFGISGACLQVEQVERGFARCLPDAPKAWRAAEAEAKKNKRGVWK